MTDVRQTDEIFYLDLLQDPYDSISIDEAPPWGPLTLFTLVHVYHTLECFVESRLTGYEPKLRKGIQSTLSCDRRRERLLFFLNCLSLVPQPLRMLEKK